MDGGGAFEALAAGECALVATDTVFGLAALPGTAGYRRIFELKQRPAEQVLPWLVSGEGMFSELADCGGSAAASELVRKFWPGPLTVVVRASATARGLGGVAADGTVALRCPADAACLDLIERLGKPLACTSANLHGMPAVGEKRLLAPELRSVAGYAELPRSCPGGTASTIVDCAGGQVRVLRGGPVGGDQIARACRVTGGLTHRDPAGSRCVRPPSLGTRARPSC